jgi:hypothetical protein
MSTRITLNHGGMAALLKSSEVRDIVRPYAEATLSAAQADPHDETFAYQNGLHIEEDTTDRAVCRVVSGDRKGLILEAKYGILARSLP